MYEAAEQQLAIVRREAQRLGDALQEQTESLARLRAERLGAREEVQRLRARLSAAESRAATAEEQHDAAERSLRKTAEEFATTQLLQKRYANTISELHGRQRAIVRVSGAAPAPSGEKSLSHVSNSKVFAVTDACTVVELEQRRSFVFDVAYASPSSMNASASSLSSSVQADTHAMSDTELAEAIGMDRVVSDVLAGNNTVFMTFGPTGGGKTEVLFGSAAAAMSRERTYRHVSSARLSSKLAGKDCATGGLLSMFVHTLFDSLAAQSVTHFSIYCSFAELAVNQTVDLLLKPQRRSGGGRGTVRLLSADDTAAATPRWAGAVGMSDELTTIPATTPEETLRAFQEGLTRMRRWCRGARESTVASTASTVAESEGAGDGHCVGGISHSVFSLTVESFNAKGHYRRAVVSFVDLCGSAAAGQTAGVEGRWIEESLQVLCDAIAATCGKEAKHSAEFAKAAAEAFDRLHSAHSNTLARFLRPVFGGNAKAVMVCCVDAERHTREQILNSLSYAYYFKSVPHQAQPYDVPPELQRLSLQMNAFLSAEDDEEDRNIEDDSKDRKV